MLLMGEVGFIAPEDPRFVSTVDAIEKDAQARPLMLRYEDRR